MKYTTKTLRGGEYTTPEVNVYSVVAESGYQASLSSGEIEEATFENWGTL